jgi:hypothetical protein
MPKYSTSAGKMLDKKVIDKRVTQCKKDYLEAFHEDHGYHFCERTQRSDLPLDCSHIISVKQCQEMGKSELAFCNWNIELLNRAAHLEIEKWTNKKRYCYYVSRKEGNEYKTFISQFEEAERKLNLLPF